MHKRRDTDKAIGNLMKWIAGSDWAEEQAVIFDAHLAPVYRHFDIEPEALDDELVEHEYAGMLFGIMFEDFLSRRLDDGSNVVDAYLQKRGWRESVHGRRYLQQLRASVLSLYEVVDVSPGRHCDVRDLVRGGKAQRVYEHRGTETMVKWDRIAARVLPADGKRVFSGGILMFPHDAANQLLEVLDNTRKRVDESLNELVPGERESGPLAPRALKRQLLEVSCPAVTRVWLVYTLGRLRAPLPELTNRDGNKLIYTETRFALRTQHREATITRLDRAPEWRRAGESAWNWMPNNETGGELPQQGIAVDTFDENQRPIRGMVELRADDLLFTANSMERARRGQDILAGLLAGLVGEPSTTTQTPQEALDERPSASELEDREFEDMDPMDAIDPIEAERVLQEYLDAHYRRCLDESIPALGGRTPRQCANSAAERHNVVEWLKHLENHELRRAAEALNEPYDCGWIWDELGLTEYRR